MEDDIKKNKNGKQPLKKKKIDVLKKMEDDFKKKGKKGRRPKKLNWRRPKKNGIQTNQPKTT